MKGLPLRSPFHPKTTLKISNIYDVYRCVCSDRMTFDIDHSLNASLFFFVKSKAELKLRLSGVLYR